MIAWDGVPTSTLIQEVAELTRQWELADEHEATLDPGQWMQNLLDPSSDQVEILSSLNTQHITFEQTAVFRKKTRSLQMSCKSSGV